jgi:hypothetical protein
MSRSAREADHIQPRARHARPGCDHFRPKGLEILPLLLGIVALSAASAARAQDILAAMRDCQLEQDDSRRLACYDRTLMRAAGKPAERASTQGRAAGSAAAAEQFGMNGQLARKLGETHAPPQPDKLRARVSAVSYKLRGEPIVTLENGQIWESAEGSRHVDIKPGDVVTIWPGLFGSYRLTTGNAAVRVSRVR